MKFLLLIRINRQFLVDCQLRLYSSVYRKMSLKKVTLEVPPAPDEMNGISAYGKSEHIVKAYGYSLWLMHTVRAYGKSR